MTLIFNFTVVHCGLFLCLHAPLKGYCENPSRVFPTKILCGLRLSTGVFHESSQKTPTILALSGLKFVSAVAALQLSALWWRCLDVSTLRCRLNFTRRSAIYGVSSWVISGAIFHRWCEWVMFPTWKWSVVTSTSQSCSRFHIDHNRLVRLHAAPQELRGRWRKSTVRASQHY